MAKKLDNILKIKIFQETACYKKPFSFKVAETYPLPPYSTVKGLFHELLAAKDLYRFNISIQGTYETVMTNYQRMLFFKDNNKVTSMPLNVQLLYNVELLIHVYFSERELLIKLKEKLESPHEYLSVGRHEDLALVTDVRFVKAEEVDFSEKEEPYFVKCNLYIPEEYLKNAQENNFGLNGIKFRLNYSYQKQNGLRVWVDKAEVKYIEKGSVIEDGKFLVDEEGDLVAFYPVVR
ncbi:type I-B CRISPR-associated protein Cas5b [Anaerocellum danielii]|uniref:Type I-B CRISPR-associated protein Cas5b n=1 Tax=Anaerocellum danielii TaxID=1387557 RepID=A0ABZ0U0X7_9FIRM|nr:type I-B CRISPR-associated protein Cas5b [Caldicellulosiruptor danielii]WPX08956.1 type I-B CRISPR-associated protein Cas5b [Caldicellulosiruptor danielii]